MRRSSFKTTTALIASLSLAVPGPVLSQEATAEVLKCLDGTEIPCLPGQEPLDANGVPLEGTVMTQEQIDARVAADAAAAEAKAAEEAAAAEAAAAEAAAAEAKAAEEAAAQKAADEAAAAEAAAAEAKAAEEAAAQKAADEAAAAEAAAAEAKAAEEAAAQKAAEEAAAAEAAAAEAKAAEEAAAQKAADEAAAAEAKAAEEAAAQKAADEAAAAEAAAAEAKAAEEAAAQKAADEAAAAEAAASEAAPAEPAGEPAPEPTAEELTQQLTEQLGLDATGEPATETVVPELPVQPEAATGEAPVAAAAEIPVEETTTETATAPDVAVVEEVVTEDSVRTSAEDFANKVNVTAAEAVAQTAAAPAAPAAQKKDKLSDLEKALLIGLGAVAVGAIISNNRKVELNSGDRVVVTRQDGTQQVIKDDDTLLRQPGSRVRTETFADGSTRTTVTRDDGTKIVTIRDAEYRVLRRVHVDRRGNQTILIDDTVSYEPVVVSELPPPAPQPRVTRTDDALALRLALERESAAGRAFSLAQVRDIYQVRSLVPVIDLDSITFDSGSAAITPDQARALSTLGGIISDYIAVNPREVFLIEGHTDAVGGAAYNLALSDRRAESVALALTEYFGIPPENLVVQGYGEEFLKVATQGDERANRRASVRRITDLLRQAAAN